MPVSDSKDRVGEFNRAVVEVARETISSVLGRTVWDAFARYLQNSTGLGVDEIPTHLEVVFSSIKNSFGIGGDVLTRRIVRSLYGRFGVSVSIAEGRPAEDYVEELKARFLKGQLPSSAMRSDERKEGPSV